ncbi:hypothetical protein ACHAWC_002363 [Mediolabrus comicus]
MTATIEVEQGNNEPIDAAQDQDRRKNAGDAGKKVRLSVVSRKYDLDGDGVLDEAEQAMRNLDKSGRGFLKSEEVYDMMNQHLKMQKDMFKMKKVLGGLIAFTFLLALSNLGTSLAAAWLSKDTTTSNGSFVDKKTSQTLSTQQQKEKFFAQPVNEERRRELTADCTADGNGNNHVTTNCIVHSFLEIDNAQGQQIIRDCDDGKIVAVCRDFQFDGSDQTTNVCKNMCDNTMTFEATHNGRNGNNKKWLEGKADTDGDGTHDATIACSSDSNVKCVISGTHFQQGANGRCDVKHDCQKGLECVANTCARPVLAVDLAEGDGCDENYQCKTGVCGTNGVCECTSDDQCNYLLEVYQDSTPECQLDGSCQARAPDGMTAPADRD